MGNWRDETAADLDDAAKRLESVIPAISGEPTGELLFSVWRAYMEVEKSIVFIRLEIDEENPGRFVSLKGYAVPDERQGLTFALKNLRKGTDSFLLGDFVRALKELRESRNYLRAMLREKRNLKSRSARASRSG